MREKRLSIFVRVCFFEGRRKRGSVVKAAKRGSVIVSSEAAALAPLEDFCLTILMLLERTELEGAEGYDLEVLKNPGLFCQGGVNYS